MSPTDAEPYPQRVFIRHSSSDAPDAALLVAALVEQAFPCWVAPRDTPPGSRCGEAIIDGINACPLFVLLLSERSNASPQVLAEAERAVSKGRSLITVRLEPVTLTNRLYQKHQCDWGRLKSLARKPSAKRPSDAGFGFPSFPKEGLGEVGSSVRRTTGVSPVSE